MHWNDTGDFYARRAVQARALAERAGSQVVRNIHLDMAERYARLAYHAKPARPVLMVVRGGR